MLKSLLSSAFVLALLSAPAFAQYDGATYQVESAAHRDARPHLVVDHPHHRHHKKHHRHHIHH
jgi:hypothetical protein